MERSPNPPSQAVNRRLLKSVLTLELIGLLSLLACTSKHSIELTDLTRTNTLRLQSRHGEFVSGISVRIAGRVDGSALLQVNDASPQRLSGAVEWKTNQLLDTPTCVVEYTPGEVRAGKLTVEYFFY
jgi:hypothetical protein